MDEARPTQCRRHRQCEGEDEMPSMGGWSRTRPDRPNAEYSIQAQLRCVDWAAGHGLGQTDPIQEYSIPAQLGPNTDATADNTTCTTSV